MDEKTLLYGLVALAMACAAGLLAYRTFLISRLSDTQIKAIFGEVDQTEFEVSGIDRAVVKMKTNYPSLIFVALAAVLAVLAYFADASKGTWSITGTFEPPAGQTERIDWRNGVLSVFPADVMRSEVGETGTFELLIAIPKGKQFEDQIKRVQYTSFDRNYTATFSPGTELDDYDQSGPDGSALKMKDDTIRVYERVPVSGGVPTATVEGN